MAILKRYSLDTVKKKARSLELLAVQQTIGRVMNLENARTLFIPGIDCCEVDEVILPAGMQMRNAVGLEPIANIYEQIKPRFDAADAELKKETFEDYAKRIGKVDFPFISIDLPGVMTMDILEGIHHITNNNVQDRIVLHFVNMAARDTSAYNIYQYGASFTQNPNAVIRNLLTSHRDQAQYMIKSIALMNDAVNGIGSMKNQRGLAYTNAICNYYGIEIQKDEIEELFRFCTGDDYVISLFDLCSKVYPKKDGTVYVPKDPFSQLAVCGPTVQILLDVMERSIAAKFQAVGYGAAQSRGYAKALYHLIQLGSTRSKPFYPLQFWNYYYISETGSPMMGDIHYIGHPRKALEIAKEITHDVGYPDQLKIRTSFYEKYGRKMQEYAKEMIKFRSLEKLESIEKEKTVRQFLGSSAKPILTKGRYFNAIRENMSDDVIRSTYRGFDTRPVVAWNREYKESLQTTA